ncbi:drebrin-like a [Sphaeramia orbicularis]|uniref:Drebrin-like protein B n=1 Tax=Sphaeramia orbicularis TaxID=375764 RepID=A0A673AQY3_9TELE|nr:drebrin-like protein B [Sphaeramia orbicularis]
MSVNLSKNGYELMAAYKDVVDGKSNTNWALFTYEGNSNDIRLAEKGEGGLEEMVEELNSGKVMYAFCRVQDPNSGLPKYVLINWTGEGVKSSRKGVCANHVSSMAGFLKGAHVTINARAEDDVEPGVILDKVSKASGASFNFHKQPKEEYKDVPRGPVGSVYRKVNAMEEIQQTNKDDFWSQAQRDEEIRRKEESKKIEQERKVLEKERKEMEDRQTRERERKAKERAQQIEQDKIYQRQREEEEREREQQRMNHEEKENKKIGISFTASVQKANEAKSLISQRSFNPRDVFKQKEQSFDGNNRLSPVISRPGKLQSPFLSQREAEKEIQREPEHKPFSDPVLPPSPAPDTSVTLLSPVTPVSPVLLDSLVAEVPPTPAETAPSPVQSADAIYTEEEEWSDEFDDEGEDETTSAKSPVEDLYESPQTHRTEEEDLYENIDTAAGEEHHVEAGEQNICAKALYDYQAADDTEITFDPGDMITGIEMIDDGWWRGYGPDGHYGMFPANYVELL